MVPATKLMFSWIVNYQLLVCTLASLKLCESTFLSSAPRYPKGHCFVWRFPGLRLLVLLIRTVLRWRWVWSIGVMMLTGENRSTQKTLSQCHVDWHEVEHGCPLREAWAMGSSWRLKWMHIIYKHALWLCYGLDDPGFESRKGQEIFLLSNVSRWICGPPISYWMDTRTLSSGLKWPGRKVDHWLPPRAEVNDEWSFIHALLLYAIRLSLGVTLPLHFSKIMFHFVPHEKISRTLQIPFI
jgi:hypothetical protein